MLRNSIFQGWLKAREKTSGQRQLKDFIPFQNTIFGKPAKRQPTKYHQVYFENTLTTVVLLLHQKEYVK